MTASLSGSPSAGAAEASPSWLRTSSVLCSRFHILAPLGIGSVARAFLCLDALVEENVVCKVAKRPAGVDTFVKEQYRALRKVRSSVFPTPIGYFEHLEDGDAWPVLVVDHAEGVPLDEWAKTAPVRARVEVFGQLAAALAELESVKIAHGDLWGPNVIVSASGRVKLIDPDGDRLGRSSSGTKRVTQDVQGFLAMLEEFLPAPDDRAVTPLKSRLRENNEPLAFSDIAGHLQALLRNGLPGELSGPIHSLSTVIANERDEKERSLRRLVERRELEFRALKDRVGAVLRSLGCFPVDQPQVVDAYQSEIAAVDAPRRGELWGRTAMFRSGDGDELWFNFEGVSSFRKPWPDPARKGLLTRGNLYVRFEGDRVAGDALELWQLDSPTLMVQEGTRVVAFTPDRLERLGLILVERIWPALGAPHHNSNLNPELASSVLSYRNLFKIRRLHFDLGTCVRTMLRLTLQIPQGRDLTSASPDGELGSRLNTIFDTAGPLRLALVRSVGDRIIKTVGPHFQSIYRIDVTEVDDLNRNLKVVFEGRLGRQDVLWTFELGSPKIGGRFMPQLNLALVSPEDPPPEKQPSKSKKAKKRRPNRLD